jgi:hypothetical protein
MVLMEIENSPSSMLWMGNQPQSVKTVMEIPTSALVTQTTSLPKTWSLWKKIHLPKKSSKESVKLLLHTGKWKRNSKSSISPPLTLLILSLPPSLKPSAMLAKS